MTFQFGKFIKDEIVADSLKAFLKGFDLPTSYTKEILFTKIEEELVKEKPVFSEEDVMNFITHEIKYGKRRHLYFSSFNFTDARKLESLRNTKVAFQNFFNYDSLKNFNTLNDEENNRFSEDKIDNYEIEFLDLKTEQNKVVNIEMCFTSYTERTFRNKDGIDSIEHYKEYVWIEINVPKRYILIRLHPSKPDAFGKNYSVLNVYNEFIEDLYRSFNINKDDLVSFNETLYKIFKDITDVSERPFRKKISSHVHLIEPFLETIKVENVFDQTRSHQLFKERVIDLLERVVIQENFSRYLGYSEGKEAVLNKMHFTDETGASVNASSGTKDGDTLELSDVFFDTRKTIDNNMSLNTLWIDWFKVLKDNETTEPERISTKIDSTTDYYLIHFQRAHHTEEVEKFVFSKLAKYEGFRG